MHSGVGESRRGESLAAASEAAESAVSASGGKESDIVLFFATAHHEKSYSEMVDSVRAVTRSRHLIGCSGRGVLSTYGEIESEPGVVVLVIRSDAIAAESFLASLVEKKDSVAQTKSPLVESVRHLIDPMRPNPFVVLLSDIYSAAPARIIREIEPSEHHVPIVGAAASFSPRSRETYQWCGSLPGAVEIEQHGVAGLTMSGNLSSHVGVAQGCQPIGEPYVVSRCERNIIYEIARKRAADVLKEELIQALGEENLKEAVGHTFIGLAMDEEKYPLERGDFLVRNMTGLDLETGAISVAELVRTGQTIQFQLRNKAAATLDMRQMVSDAWEATRENPPVFGLYFNCLGRGSHLYEIPNHDINVIKEFFGNLPLAGFFGNAELAPIGGRNFAHNYTGVLALFSDCSTPVSQ